MTFTNQSSTRHVLACLVLLFCLDVIGFRVAAQSSAVLSERPLVTRIFDSEKNESTISALLIDPQSDAFRGMLVYSADHPPPDMRWHSVEYTYTGTTPSPPQAIAFVFVPRDKYKSTPTFSITADGAVLHQGDATLREVCCVQVNGHTNNPQHIVVAVPREIFDRLTQAAKVELKLSSKRGKYSFKLNDYQRKCLLALVNTMR